MSNTWKVSTNKTAWTEDMVMLGYYEGNPVDIAFALADKACCALCFERADVQKIDGFAPTRREVSMRFAKGDEHASSVGCEKKRIYDELIGDRPAVLQSNLNGTDRVTLSATWMPDDEKDAKIRAALAKLTTEEKELLGLE